MRVLYVDDDRIHALLFAEACRSLGPEPVEIETADSGHEALALAASWQPDLLLLDLHLPDTLGTDLLPALRATLKRPDLPAWLCSADDSQAVTDAAMAAGFDRCWPKPVDVPRMVVALQTLAVRLSGDSRDNGFIRDDGDIRDNGDNGVCSA
ncbi:MAG: response regulator [Rubrivivax sp.]